MSYELITKYTVPSTTNSVSFSIPATYKDLQLVIGARCTASLNRQLLLMVVNNDTTNTNYIQYDWYTEDGSNGVEYYTSSTRTRITGIFSAGNSSSSSMFGLSKIWINGYTNSSGWQAFASNFTAAQSSSNYDNWGNGNTWKTNAAISNLQFIFETGDIAQNSVFYIYGLK